MSEKDRHELGVPGARIIENGVDLERYIPQPEPVARNVLFIGSFRHFPNIVAFRFLTEQILPLVPDVHITVVAGPEPWLHWKSQTGTLPPDPNPRVRMLDFVADVRPLYAETNVVVVPTLESAGTNVKVLEAMAMKRAVVSTSSGCAGLGVTHDFNIWIADSAQDFAAGIERLADNDRTRERLALAGRQHVERHFDWRAIGRRQRALLRELSGDDLVMRRAAAQDLSAIAAIQATSAEAAHWEPGDYLIHECTIAAVEGVVRGFLVARTIGPDEHEILNIVVDPAARRSGIARRLIEAALAERAGDWFLEVRQSNTGAIRLYESLGFHATGNRPDYYENPPEAAIVMRVFS